MSSSKERKKAFTTSSGLELKDVYSGVDLPDFDPHRDLGEPGSFPFTRGVYPSMYRGRLWTMRQYAGFGTAQESNRRYRFLLSQGQTGLSVAFDLPTQLGLDSDDERARGEIGKVGVAIDTLREQKLLDHLKMFHFHIGSQIDETESYTKSIDYILGFAAAMNQKYGFMCNELSVGGGFAVQYTLDSPVPSISVYADLLTSAIIDNCQRLGLDRPQLIIEPGRSMVARAGVALYTVGAIKDIPEVRCYASVDGGMADNIRPALYQAKLDAVVANKIMEKEEKEVTISGKFCEPGDVLITDISLPELLAGDILAVAGCGAYSIPEATNYNASFKPPIVMVNEGKPRLIRRREMLEDLIRCDIV